ncbi:MAG: hypothetical protein HOW73_50695 [Polyangiaceae bacterium]|nr:hypothetical protein [Polyangiaceae bacterium]
MNSIPPDMHWFIGRYLETLDDVEILVTLARSPNRSWSKEELETLLGASPDAVSISVRSLGDARLCDVVQTQPEVRVRLGTDPALVRYVERLESVLEMDRVELLMILNDAAFRRVRSSMTRAFGGALVNPKKANDA